MIRPRFAIRADASAEIGTGHVRRCLTLAAGLRERGGHCVLLTRDLGVDVGPLVRAAGIETLTLRRPEEEFAPGADDPAHARWARLGWEADASETVAALGASPPDVLLVDQYAFGAQWHDRVRAGLGCPLGAIDDLGDRSLAVDLIVDPTLDADHRAKHRRSVAFAPTILGGPDYALLAPVYRQRSPFAVRPSVESVGIFMGGSDIVNATAAAWRATRAALGQAVAIEIATTGANPHLAALQGLRDGDPRTTLLIDAPDLAGFFARHDLQIGAGGGATWERCCVGAPTVLVAFADNQLLVARPLHADGILLFSEAGAGDVAALARDIAALADDQPRRAALSERSRALVDGHGVERVAGALFDLVRNRADLRLRDATQDDAGVAHGWRNAESTRRYFRDPAEIALPDHLHWWRDALASPSRLLWIAEEAGTGVGVMRLDVAGAAAEVSIYLDPNRAGRGLGAAILQAGAARAAALGLEGLRAEIDPANIASQRAFARAGFSRLDERNWSRRLAP